jgi:putative membrane protein
VIAAATFGAGAIPGIPTDPWRYSPHPEVWFVVALSATAYWYALTRIGPKVVAKGEKVATKRQVWCFIGGLVTIYVASSWPIHDWAEDYLFSVHMVEHLLISLVAPPLLLLGIPQWLTRWILRPRWAAGSVRVLARPLVAGVMFNAVVAITHAPFWVNYTLYHHFWHFWSHLLLFTVSMLMWFPVVNTVPEFPRMNRPVKMIYLFLQSVIPNIPAAFLTFATGVVYTYYAHVPRPFGISAVSDQQMAGAIMKVGGTFLIWSIIVVVFFRWYAEQEKRDAVTRQQNRLAAASMRPVAVSNGAAIPAPIAQPDMEMPELDQPDVLTWEHVVGELAKTPPAQPGP